MKKWNWGAIAVIFGLIIFWTFMCCVVFGQEAKVNCPPPPPPPPPPAPDCHIELAYFQGEVLQDVEGKYYTQLSWGIIGKGSADGHWELMKVKYNRLRDQGEMFIHEIRTLKTRYFDGRVKDHYFDDHKVTKNMDVSYILVWVCGFCGDWEYYGVVNLSIPEK